MPTAISMNGPSLAQHLRGGDPPRQWAFAKGRGGNCWVRNQPWKRYNTGELIDMMNDVREKSPNLAGSRRDTATAAEARNFLQTTLNRLDPPKP